MYVIRNPSARDRVSASLIRSGLPNRGKITSFANVFSLVSHTAGSTSIGCSAIPSTNDNVPSSCKFAILVLKMLANSSMNGVRISVLTGQKQPVATLLFVFRSRLRVDGESGILEDGEDTRERRTDRKSVV